MKRIFIRFLFVSILVVSYLAGTAKAVKAVHKNGLAQVKNLAMGSAEDNSKKSDKNAPSDKIIPAPEDDDTEDSDDSINPTPVPTETPDDEDNWNTNDEDEE